MNPEEIELPEELSLEEAKGRVGFEILVPAYLPEGCEFSHAVAYNTSETTPEGQAYEAVILTYIKGEESISITEAVYEGQTPESAIMDSAEDISVNGKDGKYLVFGDMKILRWEIGNIDLSLSASLEKDELLKIAESIRENA